MLETDQYAQGQQICKELRIEAAELVNRYGNIRRDYLSRLLFPISVPTVLISGLVPIEPVNSLFKRTFQSMDKKYHFAWVSRVDKSTKNCFRL